MSKDEFVENHLTICGRRVGVDGGMSNRHQCAINLWKKIEKFGLDPTAINHHTEFQAATVEARAKLAREKS